MQADDQHHEDDEPGPDVERRSPRTRNIVAQATTLSNPPCLRLRLDPALRSTPRLADRAIRLRLRSQAPPSADGVQGSPRRQGRQPRRDDERAEAAGAARLHDLDRRLPRLHARRLAGRSRRRDRQAGRQAREDDGPQAGRSVRPAARQRAVRRQVLDAGDDGHRPQPRPQRQERQGPRQGRPATSASPTTATAASSRCTAASCSTSTASCSSTRSRRPSDAAERQDRRRAHRRRR